MNSKRLPEEYVGSWCDTGWAERILAKEIQENQKYVAQLRIQWAEALLSGEMKRAHKLWGKWQGFSGNDPWEDDGWRNFWEIQRFGEEIWHDFDASRASEWTLLSTYLSYLPLRDS
jgi:hypothetical protein